MRKKRFEYYEHKGADYILDTPNKSLDFIEMLGDCLEPEEIVDLLNSLNDENEQLKSYTGEMEDYLARLEEKNEQLRKKIAKTEKIKQQRDFYYARLQRIIKIANGDFE